MANPIRISNLAIKNLTLPSGLYIVGDSNARNLSIPHLPTIGAKYPTPGAINIELGDFSEQFGSEELFKVFNDGDIVWFDSFYNLFRSILSKNANANTLLVTEQCDNRCLFCSQPPNDLADAELYQKATLSLLNYNTDSFVGISGGEPTLNRKAFISMLSILERHQIDTPLHVLTNGRSFSDLTFVEKTKPFMKKKNIIWGIPLYGVAGKTHDSLVGANNAFVETVKGIIHLGSMGQYIELRIIPVQDNLRELVDLIEFIATALPFVGVISIMNLEPKGWARNNFQSLSVGVREQAYWLEKAIDISRLHGIPIRLFNYPLCLLPAGIRSVACQSISDWKNYYPPSCEPCELKQDCGGFFTSAIGQFSEDVEPLVWKN